MKLISIVPSTRKGKKYKATFELDKERSVTTHFGASGFRDYTLINDKKSKFYIKDVKERLKVKDAYIKRHQKREDFNKPLTAGALSKWILWTEPNINTAIKNFKRKFSV
tara:strand:- start:139 stop:465 length:327 start_codon:yes stop_codon:yes gene_type:complete